MKTYKEFITELNKFEKFLLKQGVKAIKKLKKGSKSAKRRLSFCRRMIGMKKKLTSAKTRRDPDSRINKALRRWNC